MYFNIAITSFVLFDAFFTCESNINKNRPERDKKKQDVIQYQDI